MHTSPFGNSPVIYIGNIYRVQEVIEDWRREHVQAKIRTGKPIVGRVRAFRCRKVGHCGDLSHSRKSRHASRMRQQYNEGCERCRVAAGT